MQTNVEFTLLAFFVATLAGIVFSCLTFFLDVFKVAVASCVAWLTALVGSMIVPATKFVGEFQIDLGPVLKVSGKYLQVETAGEQIILGIAFVGVVTIMILCLLAILARQSQGRSSR
jgi:hypothetical protein